jgi:hypothetical protein
MDKKIHQLLNNTTRGIAKKRRNLIYACTEVATFYHKQTMRFYEMLMYSLPEFENRTRAGPSSILGSARAPQGGFFPLSLQRDEEREKPRQMAMNKWIV